MSDPAPKKSEKRQKNVIISVRFTGDEFLAVAKLAEGAGTPVSTYLRTEALANSKSWTDIKKEHSARTQS